MLRLLPPAHRPEIRFARHHTDADSRRLTNRPITDADRFDQRRCRWKQRTRCGDGPLRIVLVHLPRAENGHDAVAQHAIQTRIVAAEDRLQAGEQPIQACRRGLRISFTGQPGAEDGHEAEIALCVRLTL